MNYIGTTVDDLYKYALNDLNRAKFQEGRGEPTKELTHVMFELLEPADRLVSTRDINPAFAFVEVLWIMAGGNSVKYLEFWNPRMKKFAQPDGELYGAYGYRLGNYRIWDEAFFNFDLECALWETAYLEEGIPQMLQAKDALQGKPSSRQVVLQIWNAESDLPLTWGDERAKDIPCNLMSHLMVRDGQLHWLQVMRSNDAVWGFPYNIIQWTFLQEIMAGWLFVKPGPFILLSDSFHTYQKHWDNIPKILSREASNVRPFGKIGLPYDKWKKTFQVMIELAWTLTTCELGQEINLVADAFLSSDASVAYYSYMMMLGAEAARIKGDTLWAHQIADTMKDNLYWRQAWIRWATAKEKGEIL